MFNNLNLKIMKKMIIFVKRSAKRSDSFYYYHDAFVTTVKSNLSYWQYFEFAKKYACNALSGYCDTDQITFTIVDDFFVQI